MKIAWLSTAYRVCGIADYSKVLWPAVARAAGVSEAAGIVSLDEANGEDRGLESLVEELMELRPEIIHFQHEYGLFGGKNPPGYRFPRLLATLRARLPGTRLFATGHTILPQDYQFPVVSRGLQAPVRALANLFLLPSLRKLWGPATWGGLDGLIVHSSKQELMLKRILPQLQVRTIPHFVPVVRTAVQTARHPVLERVGAGPKILVFGFFTPEKGQDVVIEAVSRMQTPNVQLILAGGARRPEDQDYLLFCRDRIERLRLSDRVQITGFVDPAHLDSLYEAADLVIAPFRETSGSGSLVQAFARGAAVLASDLELNREIAHREAGVVAFFRTEDPISCAQEADRLFTDSRARVVLRQAAFRYAESNSPERVAAATVEFYSSVDVRT